MSSSNPRVPEPTQPFRHQTPIQIRFNDVDMFGHVNNALYFQYFDLGKLRYFQTAIGPDFAKRGFSAVIVNINCDFFSPTGVDEEIAVLTAVVHLGDKSLTLEQRVVNILTGDVKSICRTVMAGFDPVTLKSAPLPDSIRNALEAFESQK